MEIIRGKQTSWIDARALADLAARCDTVHLDIGTGDGRFVRHLAEACPRWLVIGIDACRENLIEASRRAPDNALCGIANALALPPELDGLAAQVTINFPWGSLLDGLLAGDPALLTGLARVSRPDVTLDLRLNAGALAEAGWPLEAGAARVRTVLIENGFVVGRPVVMGVPELRAYPTTWAKRLAYGRDPRVLHLRARRRDETIRREVMSIEIAG
jgi:16S rRNA (adenine(1408)-N(1))-methyltransferase